MKESGGSRAELEMVQGSPPIFHFYVISIPTELVPSSNKLVVRVFTINYIRIVNAFGRDPSRPFSS